MTDGLYRAGLSGAEDNKYIDSRLFKHYEDVESRVRYLKCKPNDIFIDIGAAIGSWSIHAAVYGATVYAFEIGRPHTTALSMNASLNNVSDKINVYELAMSSSDGELCYDGWMKTYGSKSLGYKHVVKCVMLDTWVEQHRDELPKIDYIKIDVEGAEFEVLRGAYNTIREFWPKLIIEIHEDQTSNIRYDIEYMLKDLGYSHERIYGLNDYFYKTSV